MATSGSVNFNLQRDEIVAHAYRLATIINKAETPSTAQYTFGAVCLNIAVKQMMALNPHIWKRRIGYIFPVPDQYSYLIGSASTDDYAFGSYVTTTLTAAGALSDTTITVSSISEIDDTNLIGIVLDDGSISWDVVSGAPSGSTVTLTTGLSGAASIGNRVYVGVARINRPVQIYRFFREAIDSDGTISRSPVTKVAYDDYYTRYSSRFAADLVANAMFDSRAVDGSTTENHGIINILETVNQFNSSCVLGFIYESMTEDFDSSTDNADLPVEWINVLVKATALQLGMTDGIPDRIYARLEKDYERSLELLLQHDADNGSFFIEPSQEETYYR